MSTNQQALSDLQAQVTALTTAEGTVETAITAAVAEFAVLEKQISDLQAQIAAGGAVDISAALEAQVAQVSTITSKLQAVGSALSSGTPPAPPAAAPAG